jgi:hypothetical protein
MPKWFWWELYTAAMVEVDAAELVKKLDVAQAAMQRRLEDLARERDSNSVEERTQIVEALQGLRTLRRLECPGPSAAPRQMRSQEEAL